MNERVSLTFKLYRDDYVALKSFGARKNMSNQEILEEALKVYYAYTHAKENKSEQKEADTSSDIEN